MPITRDKENACWRFEFDRVIPGHGRVRARKRLPPGWSRAEAEAFDRKESARLYAIATGASKPSAGVEDAVAKYITERVPELKHGKRIVQELALIYWAYKGKSLAQLPDVCSTIRTTWEGKLAPATIRNRLRYLTSACRWGWKHHAMCDADPAGRCVMPKVNNERQVYTDRRGMLKIALATQCRATRALIRIAFYSGMRAGEIFSTEVDKVNWVFKIPDTKNGTPRWVPIHPRIRSAVERHMPWQYLYATYAKRWRAARKAAGMPDMVFHDVRHSTASEMINADVDLYTVGKVLGHKAVASSKRYAHLRTRTLALALSKVGGKG